MLVRGIAASFHNQLLPRRGRFTLQCNLNIFTEDDDVQNFQAIFYDIIFVFRDCNVVATIRYDQVDMIGFRVY